MSELQNNDLILHKYFNLQYKHQNYKTKTERNV